jgi:hypothetical protein
MINPARPSTIVVPYTFGTSTPPSAAVRIAAASRSTRFGSLDRRNRRRTVPSSHAKTSASRPSPTRACPASSPSGMRLRLEDDERDVAVGSRLVLLVAAVRSDARGQSAAFSSRDATRARRLLVLPSIVTSTTGSSRRLSNHFGWRSSPPFEATTTRRSPSCTGDVNIVVRRALASRGRQLQHRHAVPTVREPAVARPEDGLVEAVTARIIMSLAFVIRRTLSVGRISELRAAELHGGASWPPT